MLNAVDPTTLKGKPKVFTGTRATSNTGNLPVYTNDMPACVSWFDPVTGARGGDGRCMFMKANDKKSNYPASTIIVDDDEKLHCQTFTAEMMIKMSPESLSVANSNWRHLLNMLYDASSANKRSWGLMLINDGRLIACINDSDGSLDGTGMTGEAGSGGGPGYFYSKKISDGAPNLVDGNWHHIALTYDGAMVRIYADYSLVGYKALSSSLVYGNGMLCISGNYANSYGGIDGFIDEVRISDEALPPEKFLRVGGVDKGAFDPDTVVYLPLDTLEYSTDKFFGAVGYPIIYNSACSTNANLVKVSLSTIPYGLLPRIDTGVSAVVSNELHSGIFAANSVANDGCWSFTNNQMVASSPQTGKSRHFDIDDYTDNGRTHLISSGDFTIEFHLRLIGAPRGGSHIFCENSGTTGIQTMDLRFTDNADFLYCELAPQDQFDKYESGEISSITRKALYEPMSSINDGKWHHIALVVSRAKKVAELYLDGGLVSHNGRVTDFTLASSVSTRDYSYPKLKIGDRDDGNNTAGFHNMSIDELRITRRALAPQEFLVAGEPVDQTAFETTRAWIGFEGDLSVGPSEGAIPAGSSTASTVTMTYSPNVPGGNDGKLLDGNGNVLRESNTKSMYFSGAYGDKDVSPDTASQRLFFGRNILLERDMKSMTVEFFMKGTKNEAKAWSTILRMYGNATASDSSPLRRLWSFGYWNASGNIYIIKDVNDASQATFYPDNNVSFADGKWHHVAITFEPDGNGNTLCNIYRDYKQLGSEHTFNGEMECGDYDTSSFAAGSRYNGYLDEIRISKGVLTVDQMLHVEKRGSVITIR